MSYPDNPGLLILSALLLVPCLNAQSQKKAIGIECDSTQFSIETPPEWYADREFADAIGLKSFFYPIRDSAELTATYMYATCYPKISMQDNLENFVKADLERYDKENPGLLCDTIITNIPEKAIAMKYFRFSGFEKRYAEYTAFIEDHYSIIVIIFSAQDEADEEKFLPYYTDNLNHLKLK